MRKSSLNAGNIMNIEVLIIYFKSIKNFFTRRSNIPDCVNLGKNVFVGKNVKMDWIARGKHITIGDEATIVSGVRILCHDASSNRRINGTKVAAVTIGKRAYIGADSIILPGVNIGDDTIIGAGSVVTKDIPCGSVAVGVPARIIGSTNDIGLVAKVS